MKYWKTKKNKVSWYLEFNNAWRGHKDYMRKQYEMKKNIELLNMPVKLFDLGWIK